MRRTLLVVVLGSSSALLAQEPQERASYKGYETKIAGAKIGCEVNYGLEYAGRYGMKMHAGKGKGLWYLALRLSFKAKTAPTEPLEKIRFSDLQLVDAQGKRYEAVGDSFSVRHGVRRGAATLSFSNRDKRTKAEMYLYFLVPEKWEEEGAVLYVGDQLLQVPKGIIFARWC